MTSFAVFKYNNSFNIGDCVQSIAAQRLLPRVDVWIDRDTGEVDGILPYSRLSLIANGWHHSNYTKFPFPDNINPLFISFHINDQDHSSDANYKAIEHSKHEEYKPIATHIKYLKKHEPIGCRDLHTLNILKQTGIQAYFSGCLTLTLQNPFQTRTEEILVVDAHIAFPDLFERIVPVEVRDRCIYLSQAIQTLPPHETKMQMAQAHLDRIAQAKLVITSRLHTALPCLAFNTPVAFVHGNLLDVRFAGLKELLPCFTTNTPSSAFDMKTLCSMTRDARVQHAINNLKSAVHAWLQQLPRSSFTKNFFTNQIEFHPNQAEFVGSPGCSIVTACMNREAHLAKVLPSWLATNPNEIVIVDWNSKANNLSELIMQHDPTRSKIKLIRITNVDRWVLSHAFNLAFCFTSYEDVLKLDCDSLLNSNFFQYHNLNRQCFMTGNWQKARNENERHTNGIVFLKRQQFFAVQGYNEFIITYGYDDCDLYNRLEEHSQRLLLNLQCVSHVPHSNSDRFVNQRLGHQSRLDVEIERNRLISHMQKWKGPMAQFLIHESGRNQYVGQFVSCQRIDESLRDLALETAIKNRQWAVASNPKLRKLYIRVQNGIGNRIRVLASAYNIAKGSNRKLYIVWKKDVHCEAKFTEIFKWNYIFHDNCELIEDSDEASDMPDCVSYHGSDECNGIETEPAQLCYDYNQRKDVIIDTNSPKDIYIISACVLRSPFTSWLKECVFLRKLEPIDALASRIYEFESTHNLTDAIGVHIRQGQPPSEYKFEDTKNYSIEAKTSIEKWRTASHWRVFATEMNRILKETPKQMFLVCADSLEPVLAIKQAFPDNVWHIEKSVWDRSIQQIQSAIVDLFLLAKTKYVLGCNWSSFSEAIHRIGGQKLKLAGVDFT